MHRVLYEERPFVNWVIQILARRAGVKGHNEDAKRHPAALDAGVGDGPEGQIMAGGTQRRCGPCLGSSWTWDGVITQFSIALLVGKDQVDGRIAPVAQFD
jgi:hypothetical protein